MALWIINDEKHKFSGIQVLTRPFRMRLRRYMIDLRIVDQLRIIVRVWFRRSDLCLGLSHYCCHQLARPSCVKSAPLLSPFSSFWEIRLLIPRQIEHREIGSNPKTKLWIECHSTIKDAMVTFISHDTQEKERSQSNTPANRLSW